MRIGGNENTIFSHFLSATIKYAYVVHYIRPVEKNTGIEDRYPNLDTCILKFDLSCC